MLLGRLCRRQFGLFHSSATRFGFSSSTGSNRPNYYAVLGVDSLASLEQIKEAYRKLALKYHPDVSATSTETATNTALRFQEIAEAYAILSIEEQRRSYDFLNQPNRNSGRYTEQQALEDELSRRRSRDGQTIREPYKRGSFAEERQQFLASERAKFNVDALGRYKGGIPVQGKGSVRQGLGGTAFAAPGHAHDALIHQMKVDNDVMDYQNVTPEVAQNFANHQNMDRWVLERRKSSFIAQVDYDFFQFQHWRTTWIWLRNFFILACGITFVTNCTKKNTAFILSEVAKHSTANPGVEAELVTKLLVQKDNGMLVLRNKTKSVHH